MVTKARFNPFDDSTLTAYLPERSLVASALQSSSGVDALLRLPPGAFMNPGYRAVAMAIRELCERGRGIDLTTVHEELQRSGEIGLDGAFESSADYSSIVNEPALFPDDYARDIQAAYVHRELHQLGIRVGIEAARGDLAAVLSTLVRESEKVAQLLGKLPEQMDLRASGPALLTMADVNPERLQPLWPGYLWLGKLAVLDGDPGLGKSTLTLDLAARVSTGREMPDGQPGIPGADVLLLSAEDGVADTILPRLEAAGADLLRVRILQGRREPNLEGGESVVREISIPEGLATLEQAIVETGAKLVVIDPFMAFLNGSVNSYRDQDVRGVLRPLAAIADRTEACILIVRHLNKASGSNALYRGGGSIGIIGAVRSGLIVASDPENPTEERILAQAKNNLGRIMPSLRYRAIEAENGAPCIEWLGVSEMTPDQLLNQRPTEEDRSLTDDAVDFLRDELSQGPQHAEDVTRHARERGIPDKPLRSARKRLGVISQRSGFGPGSHVEWSLPPTRPVQVHTCPDTPIHAHSPYRASMDNEGIYDDALQGERTVTFQSDLDACPVTGNKHVTARLRTVDGWLQCIECMAVTDQRSPEYSAN